MCIWTLLTQMKWIKQFLHIKTFNMADIIEGHKHIQKSALVPEELIKHLKEQLIFAVKIKLADGHIFQSFIVGSHPLPPSLSPVGCFLLRYKLWDLFRGLPHSIPISPSFSVSVRNAEQNLFDMWTSLTTRFQWVRASWSWYWDPCCGFPGEADVGVKEWLTLIKGVYSAHTGPTMIHWSVSPMF